MKQQNFLKMNQATDTNTNGGGGSGAQQTQQNQSQTQTTQANAQQAGGQQSNAGQQQSSGEQSAQTDQQKAQAQTSGTGYSQSDDREASATGYTKTGVAQSTVQKQNEGVAKKLGYDLDLRDLDEPTVNIVTEFAAQHKLSKDAAQAMVQLRRDEAAAELQANKQAKEEFLAKRTETREGWFKQLKTDADFGGEAIWHNMKKVDSLLDNHLPSVKNMLTKNGGVLPPDIMFDLFKISKLLGANEKFVGGSGESGKKEGDLKDWYNIK